MASPSSARLAPVFLSRAVIDFLEQIVVLPDERVVRLKAKRFFIRIASLGQLAFMLVGNGEVVERGGVSGIELGGAFPAIDRLFPQTTLRHLDAELHLLLGFTSLIGGPHG